MPEIVAQRSSTWWAIWPLLLAGVLVTLALAGTIALWAHYGTAVFFETIRAGFAACFG
jgi:hypothetical protein